MTCLSIMNSILKSRVAQALDLDYPNMHFNLLFDVDILYLLDFCAIYFQALKKEMVYLIFYMIKSDYHFQIV